MHGGYKKKHDLISFLGGLGILWAIIWGLIFKDLPQNSPFVMPMELRKIQSEHGFAVAKTQTSWKFLLSNRILLINNYAFFTFGYLLFFAITWLPGYFEQTYHLHLKTIGWFLVAPWLTASIFVLIGGILPDWLWKKTKKLRIARSHLIWRCQLLSALCFIPVLFIHSIVVTILSITFGVGFGLMPNAAFYAINADVAYDRAATSLGIMDGAFAFAGILAPALTGWLAQLTGNFTAAFSLMTGLTLSSAILIILFQK